MRDLGSIIAQNRQSAAELGPCRTCGNRDLVFESAESMIYVCRTCGRVDTPIPPVCPEQARRLRAVAS